MNDIEKAILTIQLLNLSKHLYLASKKKQMTN